MAQRKSKIIVMKFGGTSVGDADRIKNVAKIVTKAQKNAQIVVVVSAVSGITNLLVNAAHGAASKNKSNLDTNIEKIREIHNNIVMNLAPDKTMREELQAIADNYHFHLESLLYSIYELGELTERSNDLISSFGERMNIHFVSHAISSLGKKTQPIEANNLIVTNDNFGDAQPLLDESTKKMKPVIKKLLDENVVPVITGFIGATKDETISTLGRGGSDFSATIIGYCIDADEVWIWTDVDGAMTADPKIVKNAQTIPLLSYNEAAELSYFGAKVLHPLTIVPAEMKKIPVWIKNTFNPEFAGTKISEKGLKNSHTVKAISTTNNLALVTLQGKGMTGVPGTAAKVFGAIAEKNINVLFISQASSEHNITFVVKKNDGERTVNILKQTFRTELLDKRIDAIKIEQDIVLVAMVGAGMEGYPGIAGKAFSELGKNKINIIAIAQGSSELNISFVIKQTDMLKSVQVLHDAFMLDTVNEKPLHLIHLGIGNVGNEVVKQIEQQKEEIKEIFGVVLSYEGKFTSTNSEEEIRSTIQSTPLPFVVIDTTNADTTTPLLNLGFERGGFAVLANKKPLSGEQKNFDLLRKIGGKRLYYECTVGAGLPVIQTLQNLLATGDEIIEIQGCFSGTLGFIFSQLDKGIPFSQAVFEAKAQGFTEPDPRDDLGGVDIARKALILARVLGQKREFNDIHLQGLYPESMKQLSPEEFLKKLPLLDQEFNKKVEQAKKEEKVLRFVAKVTPQEVQVGLQTVDKKSDLGALRGPDNLVIIKTKRYFDNPLIIKGPGAGVQVTAAGVFADIIEIVKMI